MKTYSIEIIVSLEGMSGRDDATASFVSEVIRGKIKKSLDSDPQVKKWSVCKPNEVEGIM